MDWKVWFVIVSVFLFTIPFWLPKIEKPLQKMKSERRKLRASRD